MRIYGAIFLIGCTAVSQNARALQSAPAFGGTPQADASAAMLEPDNTSCPPVDDSAFLTTLAAKDKYVAALEKIVTRQKKTIAQQRDEIATLKRGH